MMNQNQNKPNETEKGNPAWDQHNKDNGENKSKKHDDTDTDCGCGCGCVSE